jgi:hypothetical protein
MKMCDPRIQEPKKPQIQGFLYKFIIYLEGQQEFFCGNWISNFDYPGHGR